MKTVKSLTLAAVAVMLLLQPAIARADDHGAAKVTFVKWVTAEIQLPGLLETLEGVVEGDIGEGAFTGEVLKETIVGNLDEIVAFYHFQGSQHAFSAIVHLNFDLVANKAELIGVVTDGWLKGHAVSGVMIALDEFQGHSPAFAAAIKIQKN